MEGTGIWEQGSPRWCLKQKARKGFCLSRLVFAGLVHLYWVTLLATVHPRCMRLALHLGGRIFSATAVENPANFFPAKKPPQPLGAVMVMRRFSRSHSVVQAKVGVDGLLEVVPSMNLDASESVTVEERRRAWILIYSVTTRMPVNGSN